ncbi:hypothetical protein AI2971V1_2230 [Klebsiella pneumoniae]|nr:hypothetical protein AI2954V5_2242 [Klebsiella pneumoniae]CAF2923149.1 hypothetical protein AI2958V1_2222 [Klebsiella pneumoniae]CAF3023654.1 hypothetical protein AI2971V1_2230 [Klebsiella pneumoniae]CAF3034936.1 hypothetical protein AI2973V2_2226 [Klebsiella pneumoniae]CAF3079321.1 hypothetical protein AI2977V1_2234 [Klebsiella pneumoniae]
MAHLDEVIVKVDDALAEGVIAHMNELLIALSDDAQLSREERYIQRPSWATASGRAGCAPRAVDQRGRDPLKMRSELASGHQPGAHHQHHRPA